ncbi:MAG: alpha-2-macroglobulin family protein [Hyphomicrobiales bacterium]|nr:alpha-2-macroglobulin family protein [Hyphomicrobiales bacterium]
MRLLRPALIAASIFSISYLSPFPMLSGPTAAQAQTSTAAAPAQKKKFVTELLDSDVIRMQARLAKRIPANLKNRSSADLYQTGMDLLRRNDPVAAEPVLAAAVVADARNFSAWYQFSRSAILASLKNRNNRWRYLNDAAPAAYMAYKLAPNTAWDARTLELLGDSYGHLRSWRQALNFYKRSLDTQDNTALRKRYEVFRARYGFRITGYKVESDSLTPRICFRFSEMLANGKVDFAPYVAIAGSATGAIVKEGSKLCIEGLKHGQRYSIVLRQGLPSAIDEKLLKSADYEIFVRDRSPQVRFTGKNYVLPRVGQEGIPVISTNTKSIALDIIRVGDRSLLQTVRSSEFLSQIGTYKAKELIQNDGVKVWTGSVSVSPKLNEDVSTAIPVLDALKKLEPGVYAMLAVPGDKSISKRVASNDDYVDNIATQWFVVSDLGVTAFSGKDGIHVLMRSLASAKPLADVEVRLIARNNEVLGTVKTDAKGYAKFAPGLGRGAGGQAPGLIVASDKGGDYNFLDMSQTAFDLSDRGVKGRPAAQPLDAFVYTERGVYRSGETVNITALLRNARGEPVSNMPLTYVVKRPDGVEYKRTRVSDQGLGGRNLTVSLLSSVPSGTWRAYVYADPKSAAIGETTFMVEDYVPERLELTLSPESRQLSQGATAKINAEARYLYGAPGASLTVNGELYLRLAGSGVLPGHPGFRSGLADQEFETIKKEIEASDKTGSSGKAVIETEIPKAATNRPLEARFVLRAAEPGGRAVERVLVLPVRPGKPLIAVKNTFDTLREGSHATFEVIALDADGKRVAAPQLQWSLYRVSNTYQWYYTGGRWQFERIKSSQRVSEGKIDVDAAGAAKLDMPVRWGAHRLEIKAEGGKFAPVSVNFSAGWSGDVSASTPDLLEVTIDKKNYAAGDTMKMQVNARFEGKATIAIISDQVREMHLADLKKGDNVISIPVKDGWGASAYAVAIAHRPLDSAARRMPGRALGLAAFSVDTDKRKLSVAIETPEKVQPRRTVTVPVRIGGLAAGEEAYVTVAAVDVGILNLTRFKTPDPTPYFFGQRQLSTDIRDLYGLLIDGMQGTRGAIRSGGDAAGAAGNEGNRPTQEPLSRFSGIVKVDPDGVATVNFELPAFNGTARLMAVAWSKSAVGSAEKDLIIRDPVVVQATLPRLLNFGDASRFHVQIDNVDGAPGDYTVDVDVHGPVSIAADALRHTFKLAAKQRVAFSIPVKAAGIGTADINLTLNGPNLEAPQTFSLRIAPGTSQLYRRVVRTIPAGGSVTVSSDLLADFLPGTGAIALAASPYAGIDVPALLQALDRYPYGCTEQTVSRALPLLYVSKLATTKQLALDGDAKARVQKAIDRVMARQDSSGRFGLWSAGSGQDLWLDSFVTDFLTRARENGYSVPARGFDQALDWLRNQVANTTNINAGNGANIAYAIYVLARNGRPVMGDLRYLAETKIGSFSTALARAQIGAALALLGDRGRAARAFESAAKVLADAKRSKYSRRDYGSILRDSAGFLALAAEANAGSAVLMKAALKVQEERSASTHTSTQENTWMVLAAASLANKANELALTIDGQAHKGSYYRTYKGNTLDGRSVTIGNSGQAPVQVVLTTSGYPAVKEPAESRGYQLERTYYTMNGKAADLKSIRQNDRLVVVLKVTETEAAYGRLLLVDMLPAGLEIDNPNLVDSGSISGMPWLKSKVSPVHTDYRDDRFVAAFTRNGRSKAFFYTAYVVRAVTPGHYTVPPATIEDMYRPERFGRTAFSTLDIAAPK